VSLRDKRRDALSEISDFNPFVNQTFDKTTLYEKVKLVVGGCTVLPLRCLFLGPTLLTLYGASKLAISGVSDEKMRERPLSPWRRRLIYPTMKFGSRALLFFLGYQWIKTKGEPVREVPIVICNHPSWFEHLWMVHVYVPSVVGKEDIKRVPFYGTYAKALQSIFVKRSSPDSRKEAAVEIQTRMASRYEAMKTRIEEMREKEERREKKGKKGKKGEQQSEASLRESENQHCEKEPEIYENEHDLGENNAGLEENRSSGSKKQSKSKRHWPPLFLFPEGGNSSTSGLISFKLGAFNPGVPIQPVLVRLPYKHHDVSPTPGTNKIYLLLRTLSRFSQQNGNHLSSCLLSKRGRTKRPQALCPQCLPTDGRRIKCLWYTTYRAFL